jgi:hypothetical protein
LYIRAIDKSGARSSFAKSYTFYVKKPTSNILLIDAYTIGGNAVTNFYGQQLSTIGRPVFDTLRIFETNTAGTLTQQAADNLTQALIFKLFNKIIWYTNDPLKSLTLAQQTTAGYFAAPHNGKLFFATAINTSFDPQSSVLGFTPVQQLTAFADTSFIIQPDSLVQPFAAAGYTSSLKGTGFNTSVKPLVPRTGATPLYFGAITARKISTATLFNWAGNSTLITKGYDNSNNANFIFSAIELQNYNGNSNVSTFLNKALITDLGF